MKKFLGKKKAPEENPYAQQQAEQDAYNSMTPYQRARADVNSAGGRPGGLPSGPGPQRNSPAPSAGSGNPYASNQGYGSDRYGSGGGYGSDRYGSNTGAYNSNAPPPASGRSGGYGGFGPRDDDPSANDSNDLFGGAKSRVPPGQNPYENNPYAKSTRPDPNLANNPYANPSANRGGNAPDYGGSDYANENLTPEELEEKEISQIKQQQKQARVDALSSANRTLQMMDQIEVTGRGTLARLGQQSERLHNAKDNLTIAESHTKVAQDKAKELKTLNRSMFAVHVSNPFTSGKRERAADEAILNRNRGERQARESNRADAYASNQRMERHFEALDKYQSQPPPERPARSQADKSKYDFENDSEDEAMEEQIDAAMYKMEQGAPKLKELALRMGQEIDEQNKFIDTIQTDHIHDGIVRTQATLNRIK